jgi:hypothetical protein
MDIKDLEEGVVPLSEADKANLAAVAEEKKRLGIEDDEPESATPGKEEAEDGIVLGPEDKPATVTQPKEKVEKKDEAPVQPADPADPSKNPEDKKQPEAVDRPVKYKPLPEYLEEKKEWKTSLETKDAAIVAAQAKIEALASELEAAKASGGKDESASKIASLAERIGIEPELAKEFIDLAREGLQPPAPVVEEKKASPAPTDPFPGEWDNKALPELRAQYPTATADQLADAKQVLDEAAHGDFRTYPMDYILWKKGEDLKTILSNPRKKSIEGGAHGKADYTPPTDQGKPDFDNMTPAKARELEKARAAAAEAEEGEGIRIMRNGNEMKV